MKTSDEILKFLREHQAFNEGKVRIKNRKGQTFLLTPEQTNHSSLDIEGTELNLTSKEIVSTVRHLREQNF